VKGLETNKLVERHLLCAFGVSGHGRESFACDSLRQLALLLSLIGQHIPLLIYSLRDVCRRRLAMVIDFMLGALLGLDVVAIFFFFLALALDQVTNSNVIEH
jgi:hypothetical protein